MKKKLLLLPLAGVFAFLTLTSSSSGYNGNRTGSTGGSTGCGSCHGSSATSGVTIAFELDSAGVPVTHYVGGMTYTLKMTGTNTTTNSLPKFGFELSTVTGSGTTAVQGGTFNSVASPYRTRTTSGITYLEQSGSNSPSSGSGATGTVYSVSISWTAPAAGSGTVSAFGLINAVNGDGNDGSSDKWNLASATFAEEGTPTGIETVIPASALNVYPNPVSNRLNISMEGNYNATVFDIAGRAVAQVSAAGSSAVSSSDWKPGIYEVVVTSNGVRSVATIVKQ